MLQPVETTILKNAKKDLISISIGMTVLVAYSLLRGLYHVDFNTELFLQGSLETFLNGLSIALAVVAASAFNFFRLKRTIKELKL